MRNIVRTQVFILLCAWLLTGCFGEKYTVETEVHDDGSIDRKVSHVSDSTTQGVEAFGASEASGWLVTQAPDTTMESGFANVWSKHFVSVEEANAAAEKQPGGFRIRSTFEKQYRWLFTTTRFTETYAPAIRFEGISPSEYFDAADLDIMARATLNDSMAKHSESEEFEAKFEKYLFRGFMEEFVKRTSSVMLANKVEERWVDTLKRHKMDLMDLGRPGIDITESYLTSYLVDSIKMPIAQLSDTLSNIVPDELFETIFDQVEHTIVMPGDISASNSVWIEGRNAHWSVAVGGSVQDITLYAESQTWNYKEIGFSFVVLLAAILYFARRRG